MSSSSVLFVSRRLQAVAAALLCLVAARLAQPEPSPADPPGLSVRGTLLR